MARRIMDYDTKTLMRKYAKAVKRYHKLRQWILDNESRSWSEMYKHRKVNRDWYRYCVEQYAKALKERDIYLG